jgi:DNA-binding transcriptional regulator LsrR (DeoR family)
MSTRHKTNNMSDNSQFQGLLVQVAHLYYDENLSQQKIADRVGVSRSLIAQYLQRARETGVVKIHISDPDNACENLTSSLKKETGIKFLKVVPTPHRSEELVLRAVGFAAAEFITNELSDGDTLGLAWGRSTNVIVNLMQNPHARGLEVLPLLGESAHSGNYSQMNQLVVRAAEKLGARPQFLSLPIIVSSARLCSALAKEEGISNVIKGWDHTNLACVGIGVVPPVPGMVVYIGEEHLPPLNKAGAVGDICGTYFDREGNIIKSGFEDRFIGVGVKEMRAIDCMAAVACGEEKAIAVLGALRTGLISALFIDQRLAERILALIRSAESRKK